MKETQHRLRSHHLANERTVWVREPDETPRSLTVFLDAELYRDRVGALSLIDELHATGAIDRSLFVFVSMESVASRWVECPCHAPFARFIDEEFFPWLEDAYPDIRGARERVIAGLSYTGLAAAYVAMMAPSRFTKVIAQSGSFWSNDCWIVEHLEKLEIKPKTEFYLDVGLRETEENVRHKEDVLQVVSQIEGVRRFRDALLRCGYEPQYVEFDGGHDCAAWSRTLPAALRWALPIKGRVERKEPNQALEPTAPFGRRGSS
jgi:enterochelin esterase family protein